MKRLIPLEKAAEKLCEDTSKPPFIFQLSPEEGREILNKNQDTESYKYSAAIEEIPVKLKKWGTVKLYYVKPDILIEPFNAIFYIHGGGWVFGNFKTHEKLVRELANRTKSVIIFPEYSLSPEAKYPTAIGQCYSILCALPELAIRANWNINFDTLTVAGDSVGGNMATVMAILAKKHDGIKIHKQLLYYPVTNAEFNTESYNEFAEGYYLYRDGMKWFWDQYTISEKDRNNITASPLKATINELKGLPDTLIICGEADVLRDEGEMYAKKLMEAGVDVTNARINGTIHDFVMLNSLDETNATRTAMDISVDWINKRNHK